MKLHFVQLRIHQVFSCSSAIWKCAVVTPIPEVDQPTALKDLRPISVTPILSGLFKCLIIHKLILPPLSKPLFDDQFAIRPSGHTTAALSFGR